VIFGESPPAGKMPVTAYASTEQAGNITDMDMSKGRTYRYLPGAVRKTRRLFLPPFLCKNAIILPRQAQDKHRESTQKSAGRFLAGEPTYPFGFGLSYTNWSYSMRTNITGGEGGGVLESDAVGVVVTVQVHKQHTNVSSVQH
jgi:hypothetical protein